MGAFLKVTVAAILLAIISPAEAAGDLMELWHSALANNPTFAATRAQREAEQQKRREANALNSPQLLLSAGARYQTVEQTTSGARFSGPGFGTQTGVDFNTREADATGLDWSLTLKHNLYSTERDATTRQLSTEAEIGNVSTEAAQQDLMLLVVKSYFDVLEAQDSFETLTTMETATREALDQAHARYQIGDAPVTDESDAQARFDLIEAQLLGARNELAIRRSRVEDLTGETGFRLAQPQTAAADPIGSVGVLGEWQQRASDNDPNVKRHKLLVDIADTDVARFHAAVSPTIEVYARIDGDRLTGDGYGADGVSKSSDRTVGVQMNVPLWTGGMRSAKSQEAVLLKEKSLSELKAEQQNARRNVREAWLTLGTWRAQAAALDVALRSAQTRLDANRTGFSVGDRPAIDVLDAQQALYSVQHDLARARYGSFTALLSLYAAVGELDESRLQEVNASLR